MEIDLIKECNSRDLKRAFNSNKKYLFFQFNIFNGGISAYITCTSKKIIIDHEIHNGYDFIVLNDNDFKETLKFIIDKKNKELKEILK